MKLWFKKAAVAAAAVSLASGLAIGTARAGTVSVTDSSWYGLTGLTINAAGASYTGYPVGPQQITIAGQSTSPLEAWCIDFNHDITVPGTYTLTEVPFSVAGLSSVSGLLNTPDPKNILTAQNPAGLVNQISFLIGSGMNLPASNATTAQQQQATAIQIAIWDLLYGQYNATTNTGGVQVVDNGIGSSGLSSLNALISTDLANAALAVNTPSSLPVYALISSNGGVQQLAFAVPEPATMTLMAGGVFAMAALRRRRKARA